MGRYSGMFAAPLLCVGLLIGIAAMVDSSVAAPFFTENYTVPSFPSDFGPAATYSFQVNVSDLLNSSDVLGLNSVSFQLYGPNLSGMPLNIRNNPFGGYSPPLLNVSGRVFYINFTQSQLGRAGDYVYVWSANNSTGGSNTTGNLTFTVNKAGNLKSFLDVYVQGVPNVSTSVTYPSSVTLFGSFNSSFADDAGFQLSRQGFGFAANNTLVSYPAGFNDFVYGPVFSGSNMQNWTLQNSSNVTVAVSKGTLSNFLEVLTDGSTGSLTFSYNGSSRNVTGRFNSTGASDITLRLFNASSGTSLNSVNATLDIGVGWYLFLFGTSTSASQNWTVGNSSVVNLTINKGDLSSLLGVTINGSLSNSTNTYPDSVHYVSGNGQSIRGASDIFLMLFNATSGLSINASQNNVTIDRPAGTHLFVYGTNSTSAQNWTVGNSSVGNITIAKGPLPAYLDVLIGVSATDQNASVSDQTTYYPANGNAVFGRFRSKGASDLALDLFSPAQWGVSTSSQNGTTVNRSVGSYTFVYGTNSTSSQNWTIGNTSTRTLTVSKGTFYVDLRINGQGPSFSAGYSSPYNISFNVSEARFGPFRLPPGSGDVAINVYRELSLFSSTLNTSSRLLHSGNASGNSSVSGDRISNGTHFIIVNTTGGGNWTSASYSMQFSVSRVVPNITIFLDGSPKDRAYVRGDVINITASSDALDNVTARMNMFVNFTGQTLSIANTSSLNALYNLTDTSGLPVGTYAVSANISDPTHNYTSVSNDTIFINLTDAPSSPPAPSSGGGGSSSSASARAPAAESAEIPGESLIESVSPGKPAEVVISDPEVPLTRLTLSVSSEASGVKISVRKVDEGDIVARLPQKVFSYLEIEKENITDSSISGANISFRLPVSWMEENDAERDEISLYRYSGGWGRLDTRYAGSTPSYFYYEASSPGFSTFAIVVEERAEAPVEELAAVTEQPERPAFWIFGEWYFWAILGAFAAGAWFSFSRMRGEKSRRSRRLGSLRKSLKRT